MAVFLYGAAKTVWPLTSSLLEAGWISEKSELAGWLFTPEAGWLEAAYKHMQFLGDEFAAK